MRMVPVVSSNVRAVGYEASSRVLRVAFHSGRTYEYQGVPIHLYEAMLHPHPWRRIGRQVQSYPYRRVAA